MRFRNIFRRSVTDEAELSEFKEADKIDEEINKKIKKKRKKNSKTVVRNGKKVHVKKVPKNLSDPDSGLIFRDKKPRIFGYLSHNTVDSKNGITHAVTVTPAYVSHILSLIIASVLSLISIILVFLR